VGVYDAFQFGACAVDRAVNHITRLVDAVVGVRFPQNVALKVDLDQIRRRDFLVEQAVEIDQQMLVITGDPCGDVVVDQVGHAEAVGQAITGREVDPGFPLFGADFIFDAAELG
jgi:hypothetical protein